MMERLRDIIEWVDGTDNYTKRLIKKTELYEKIVIFGVGIGGIETLHLLQEERCADKVVAFSDNNKEKIDKDYAGYPVIAPEHILVTAGKALILISSTAYDIISKQLIRLGISKRDIMYFQPAGMSLQKGDTDVKFIKNYIEKFEQVFEMLEDNKSKKIYMCILNYRISKNVKWLEEMEKYVAPEDNQYFDQDILKSYHFEEGFVDGGAYLGDTLEHFFEHFPKWRGVYYCIEAGEKVYSKMCDRVKKIPKKNIKTYNYALWDSNDILHFDTTSFGGAARSHVSDTGEEIECIMLDELFKENIDFIKMDIEGAEKKALIGSKNVNKKNRPVLTICIYHRPEDFFEIPLLINDFLPNEYSFYIRQYRYGQSETVLYAMPEERVMEEKCD